jgi:carboxypeptidase C (cathepsin A)
MKRYLALFFFALTAASVAGYAQTTPPPGRDGGQKPEAASQAPAPVETKSATKHEITVNGKKIPYTATAGTLVLKQDNGKPWASMFYVAYTRDDALDAATRPITFSFNGGPGSSSVWLHLGALGPLRVVMGPNGEPPKPPFQLVENQDTALEFTDLVFIDPVSTGYSREAPGVQASEFHGFQGDLKSVAEFIRLFLTRSNRWGSPKFLAGESYGTTRAAALSQYLIENGGIYLNGITLISSVLNFGTISFDRGNDLPFALYLPTYTATAWYHKRLPDDLQSSMEKAIGESRKFAGGDYPAALMKGDKLTAPEKATIVRELSRLTGLSPTFIEESNLRIPPGRFRKELMRGERETVGRYDARLPGLDEDAAGDRPDYDPSYSAVLGVFTAMFNRYVRTELKYETDLTYEVLTDKVNPWSFRPFENRYVNVSNMLRDAMTQNQAMLVMIANGYYDLATPFFATEYTVNHLGLEPALAGHVSLTYCGAGHMLYTVQPCLDSLHGSMSAFYQKAAGRQPGEFHR